MGQAGLPAKLYQRIQAGLSHCGPFDNDRTLRAIFVDERIARWRDLLPEMMPNRAQRVSAVIAALIEKFDERGKNALALLLLVLGENIPPGDASRSELMSLAQETAAVLETGEQKPAGVISSSAGAGTPVNTKALRDCLKRLSSVQFEALCLDEYPKIYEQFSRGLQHEEKLTLLLDYVRKHPEEAARLKQLVNEYE